MLKTFSDIHSINVSFRVSTIIYPQKMSSFLHFSIRYNINFICSIYSFFLSFYYVLTLMYFAHLCKNVYLSQQDFISIYTNKILEKKHLKHNHSFIHSFIHTNIHSFIHSFISYLHTWFLLFCISIVKAISNIQETKQFLHPPSRASVEVIKLLAFPSLSIDLSICTFHLKKCYDWTSFGHDNYTTF